MSSTTEVIVHYFVKQRPINPSLTEATSPVIKGILSILALRACVKGVRRNTLWHEASGTAQRSPPTVEASIMTVHFTFVLLDGVLFWGFSPVIELQPRGLAFPTQYARRKSTSPNVAQGRGSRTPMRGSYKPRTGCLRNKTRDPSQMVLSLNELPVLYLCLRERDYFTARSCQHFLHLLTRTSFPATATARPEVFATTEGNPSSVSAP